MLRGVYTEQSGIVLQPMTGRRERILTVALLPQNDKLGMRGKGRGALSPSFFALFLHPQLYFLQIKAPLLREAGTGGAGAAKGVRFNLFIIESGTAAYPQTEQEENESDAESCRPIAPLRHDKRPFDANRAGAGPAAFSGGGIDGLNAPVVGERGARKLRRFGIGEDISRGGYIPVVNHYRARRECPVTGDLKPVADGALFPVDVPQVKVIGDFTVAPFSGVSGSGTLGREAAMAKVTLAVWMLSFAVIVWAPTLLGGAVKKGATKVESALTVATVATGVLS